MARSQTILTVSERGPKALDGFTDYHHGFYSRTLERGAEGSKHPFCLSFGEQGEPNALFDMQKNHFQTVICYDSAKYRSY